MSNGKTRIIQEYVPGKQITLAHLIANPKKELNKKLGLNEEGAIGVLTITPSEVAIIAGDIAIKAADVKIGFIDRFTGSLMIWGKIADVETALREINLTLENKLGFTPAKLTRT
ncbi:MAG: BMC domain-containing protein [Firmicutes bacterium]|nr:BMC domain-containing protein [Bacillota bacterium]